MEEQIMLQIIFLLSTIFQNKYLKNNAAVSVDHLGILAMKDCNCPNGAWAVNNGIIFDFGGNDTCLKSISGNGLVVKAHDLETEMYVAPTQLVEP